MWCISFTLVTGWLMIAMVLNPTTGAAEPRVASGPRNKPYPLATGIFLNDRDLAKNCSSALKSLVDPDTVGYNWREGTVGFSPRIESNVTVNLPPACQSIWAMAISFDSSILPWSNQSLVLIYTHETCDPSKLQFRSFYGEGLGSSSFTNVCGTSSESERMMFVVDLYQKSNTKGIVRSEFVFFTTIPIAQVNFLLL